MSRSTSATPNRTRCTSPSTAPAEPTDDPHLRQGHPEIQTGIDAVNRPPEHAGTRASDGGYDRANDQITGGSQRIENTKQPWPGCDLSGDLITAVEASSTPEITPIAPRQTVTASL